MLGGFDSSFIERFLRRCAAASTKWFWFQLVSKRENVGTRIFCANNFVRCCFLPAENGEIIKIVTMSKFLAIIVSNNWLICNSSLFMNLNKHIYASDFVSWGSFGVFIIVMI